MTPRPPRRWTCPGIRSATGWDASAWARTAALTRTSTPEQALPSDESPVSQRDSDPRRVDGAPAADGPGSGDPEGLQRRCRGPLRRPVGAGARADLGGVLPQVGQAEGPRRDQRRPGFRPTPPPSPQQGASPQPDAGRYRGAPAQGRRRPKSAGAVNSGVSEQITRKSASNLALAFILLPPEKRVAMSALYAFCRQVDDAADEDSIPVDERRRTLAAWRTDIAAACEGREPSMEVNRELAPHIHTYRLPFRLFDELILGVETDLVQTRYNTPSELELYCYRVASVVGLLSIEIFGYTDPACRAYADALGKALQLTNILRDVGNDSFRGRIYLPLSDLERFRVRPEEILRREWSERFHQLALEVDGRARGFYRRAREILPVSERASMVSADLMGNVYWRLLERLERSRFHVLDETPQRLSRARKIGIILGAILRSRLGLRVTSYGGD
ncbi:MAG: presqualene diphosphate synthase HpnD [Verrucomicrobia bacterium]|nr:presqualene diphosphate synthase HpnD [Verrucomicrobiota bacterium]